MEMTFHNFASFALITMLSSCQVSNGFVIPKLLVVRSSLKKMNSGVRVVSISEETNAQHTATTLDDDDETTTTRRIRKRDRFFNAVGLHRLNTIKKKDNEHNNNNKLIEDDEDVEPINLTTIKELNEYWTDPTKKFRKVNKNTEDENEDEIDYDKILSSMSVMGDTQNIGSTEHLDQVHPCLKLLHERRRTKSTCIDNSKDDGNDDVKRSDGCKVALVIEGGGMRGCVSAGMVTALHYLGLDETFDVVYGSSAGSVIGAYFITKQLPWFGPEIYYDSLTTAGRDFIDTRRLLRALGVGLLNPYLLKDVLLRPDNGKPVLNLDYLLKTTAHIKKPLDWDKFVNRQKYQPLKVVASGLKSEKSIIMDYESGSFQNMEELTNCMHGSCLLPGIAGPVMNIHKNAIKSGNGSNDDDSSSIKNNVEKKFIIANNLKKNADENNNSSGVENSNNCYEPLADALLYETIPYRSALKEGATHCLVLRTRPDGVDTTGKSSIFERLIFKRFFTKKNKLHNMYNHVQKHLHKKIYGEDIIRLNEASKETDRDYMDMDDPHLMTIALPPDSKEVTRLETSREEIFDGVRRGFARAYDCLVEDPNERGRGHVVAKEIFPDEILHYDPLEIESLTESAFEVFLKETATSHTDSDDDASSSKSKQQIRYEPVAR